MNLGYEGFEKVLLEFPDRVSGKIDTWTVVENKLYFNYNQDVKKEWSKNQQALIIKADKNWPTVKKDK